MFSCEKCNKSYKLSKTLNNHNIKNPNCINKCNICLKIFTSTQILKRHESVACIQKFECDKCNKVYKSRFRLNNHKCYQKNNEIGNILKNIPNSDKQINIITINNINEDNSQIIKNKQINNNNSNNKIMNNNFFDTQPKNFGFNYNIKEDDIKGLLEMDDYSEEHADKYMYEEQRFKEEQPKDLIYKYDKEALQVEGMKILFTKLQDDPKNRNVMIRKTKSGKCYVYEKEWVEEKLQKIVTKICNKLCDTLYNKETSLNHFIRLVMGSQPKRFVKLRKHIEDEIINLKDCKLLIE